MSNRSEFISTISPSASIPLSSKMAESGISETRLRSIPHPPTSGPSPSTSKACTTVPPSWNDVGGAMTASEKSAMPSTVKRRSDVTSQPASKKRAFPESSSVIGTPEDVLWLPYWSYRVTESSLPPEPEGGAPPRGSLYA